MLQSFVTTAHHLRGRAGDSRANVRGSDLLSFPLVPGKCQACDIMQIYPHGIYYSNTARLYRKWRKFMFYSATNSLGGNV